MHPAKYTHTSPEAIFAQWEPLAYKLTTGWRIPGHDAEDLQQEARIVIFRCAQVFDPARRSFFTLAARAIHNRLALIRRRSLAQKRVAFFQSLDEVVDGVDLHERIPADSIDSTLPDGVAVREILQEHIDRKRESLSARRNSRSGARAKREIDAALDMVHAAYGIEPAEFLRTSFIPGVGV